MDCSAIEEKEEEEEEEGGGGGGGRGEWEQGGRGEEEPFHDCNNGGVLLRFRGFCK